MKTGNTGKQTASQASVASARSIFLTLPVALFFLSFLAALPPVALAQPKQLSELFISPEGSNVVSFEENQNSRGQAEWQEQIGAFQGETFYVTLPIGAKITGDSSIEISAAPSMVKPKTWWLESAGINPFHIVGGMEAVRDLNESSFFGFGDPEGNEVGETSFIVKSQNWMPISNTKARATFSFLCNTESLKDSGAWGLEVPMYSSAYSDGETNAQGYAIEAYDYQSSSWTILDSGGYLAGKECSDVCAPAENRNDGNDCFGVKKDLPLDERHLEPKDRYILIRFRRHDGSAAQGSLIRIFEAHFWSDSESVTLDLGDKDIVEYSGLANTNIRINSGTVQSLLDNCVQNADGQCFIPLTIIRGPMNTHINLSNLKISYDYGISELFRTTSEKHGTMFSASEKKIPLDLKISGYPVSPGASKCMLNGEEKSVVSSGGTKYCVVQQEISAQKCIVPFDCSPMKIYWPESRITDDTMNRMPKSPASIIAPDATHDTTPSVAFAGASDEDGDALSYMISLSSAPDRQDFRMTANSSTHTLDEVEVMRSCGFGAPCFMCVKACDDSGSFHSCSEGFLCKTITFENNQPVSGEFADQADTHDNSVTLSWARGEDNDAADGILDSSSLSWEFQMDNNSNWSDGKYSVACGGPCDLKGLKKTRVTAGNLTYGIKYHARSRACDSHGLCDGTWEEEPDGFAVKNSAPEVLSIRVTPEKPRANDTIRCSAQGRDADGDTVTMSYEWLVNGASVRNESAATANESLLSSKLFQNLQESQFRKGDSVSCRATPDDRISSGTSIDLSFKIADTVPESPKLLTPANGAIVTQNVTRFAWQEPKDLDGDSLRYSLKIYSGGALTAGYVDIIQKEVSVPLRDGIYSWVVESSDGELFSSSEERMLRVDSSSPAITVVGPTGILITYDAYLIVKTDESAACRYSADAGLPFANMTGEMRSVNGTSHFTAMTLGAGNHKYYVRCSDEHGNANPSSTEISFTIDASYSEAQSPANDMGAPQSSASVPAGGSRGVSGGEPDASSLKASAEDSGKNNGAEQGSSPASKTKTSVYLDDSNKTLTVRSGDIIDVLFGGKSYPIAIGAVTDGKEGSVRMVLAEGNAIIVADGDYATTDLDADGKEDAEFHVELSGDAESMNGAARITLVPLMRASRQREPAENEAIIQNSIPMAPVSGELLAAAGEGFSMLRVIAGSLGLLGLAGIGRWWKGKGSGEEGGELAETAERSVADELKIKYGAFPEDDETRIALEKDVAKMVQEKEGHFFASSVYKILSECYKIDRRRASFVMKEISSWVRKDKSIMRVREKSGRRKLYRFGP